jgi:hypothetical protein
MDTVAHDRVREAEGRSMIKMREPDALEVARRVGMAYRLFLVGAELTNRQETDLYVADREAWRAYRERLIGERARQAA